MTARTRKPTSTRELDRAYAPATNPLSARIVPTGGAYYDLHRQRLVHLPDTHCAVVCDGCEWSVHLPSRMGLDWADLVRRSHLLSAHLQRLIDKEMVLGTYEMREGVA